MKAVNAAEMRKLDQRTIASGACSGTELMRQAGGGVARQAVHMCPRSDARILLAAGHGNNGGDALVAARRLHQQGRPVEVWLTGTGAELKGEAQAAFEKAAAAGVPIRALATAEQWDAAEAAADGFELVVDGLLGTGVRGAARGLPARAIQTVNRFGAGALVLSIDVPSGIDADSGASEGEAVCADCTVTLGLPKAGLLTAEGIQFTGRLEVHPLGFPESYVAEVPGATEVELISRQDAARWRPARRSATTHKGDFGRVLLIGGSTGFSGAVVLAARAALRSGVGLVSVRTPAAVHTPVAAAVPGAMVHPFESAALAQESFDAPEELNKADAVLAGPGLGAGAETRGLIERLVENAPAPLVLDADALNVFAGEPEQLRRERGPTVITPHPGEAARLLGVSVNAVQQDRRGAVRELAQRSGAVTVLKGAGTLTALPGADRVWVNVNGNPGMACGGSGDVLGGLLTGLIPQCAECYQAVRLAVWLHGRAGDLAAVAYTRAAMQAEDLIGRLPAAFRELTPR